MGPEPIPISTAPTMRATTPREDLPVRLVRFLVGAGAAAAAAYIVFSRRTDGEAGGLEYPASQDWWPASEIDTAHAQTAAAVCDVAAIPETVEGAPIETGRFAMRGWAAAAGHAVVCGVTFRRRLARDVGADEIEIQVDATDNVPGGGLLILRDGGFAPSREGFALMLAAAGAGPFSAAGSYRVFAPK